MSGSDGSRGSGAARAGILTVDAGRWSLPDLVAAKRGRRVSVVLPALDEEDTVAEVVASILPLVDPATQQHAAGHGPADAPAASATHLVDELVLVDSGSTDATRERAAAAGARVVGVESVFADAPPGLRADLRPRRGKGETLWRSLAVTGGDIVAFVDTDLRDPGSHFVPGIVGPLLMDPSRVLVKAFYRRPYRAGDDGIDPFGGGRVTELAARPLLQTLVPELAELRQPLAGEYAMRRDFAESVPFAAEYGVEIGLVLDAFRRFGAAGLAQVDLGVREHRHRDLDALSVTSRQVLETAFGRLGVPVVEASLAPDRPPLRAVRDRIDAELHHASIRLGRDDMTAVAAETSAAPGTAGMAGSAGHKRHETTGESSNP